MKLFLRFSIFFSILLISLPSSTSDDKTVLLQIKKIFNNPEVLSSWDPKTDECTYWIGIECIDYTVTTLRISVGEISGQIPIQIGDLSHLDTLEFADLTNLTGTIPRSITELEDLKHLRLINTNLSGPIPDYISELKNLESLELTGNQFTGPIPDWLSQMSRLRDIDLSYNKLTGDIPDSFVSFASRLSSLFLSNNELSGKIPESWLKHHFKIVDISGNMFNGDGSMFFGQNKITKLVDLSRNNFKFDLSEVKFPKNLISLDISENQIFGELPSEMSKLPLVHLNVSNNRLCGIIPRGGVFQQVDKSAYSHNKCLCGPPLKDC